MTTIERKDLVDAVLASRDEVDPDFESDLLEAIVDAEADAAGDGDAAMRAIDAAVTSGIERGVGYLEEMEPADAAGDDAGADDGGADEDEEDES